jgi:putative PLP-dependent aminotransferase (TIGR04422 family)
MVNPEINIAEGTPPPYFLWPRAQKLSLIDFLGGSVSSEEIEELLLQYFPESYPVLFSSARAALSAILEVQGIKRADLVYAPPYSSHCVLEAIARFGAPETSAVEGVRAAVVYHQWGIRHQARFNKLETLIIEDAVDSILIPAKKPFLCENSQYTLWSLPKVVASTGGGVAFCRRRKDANELKNTRGVRTRSAFQAHLRNLSHKSQTASVYWNGAESLQGELTAPYRKQVMRLLKNYNCMVDNRGEFLMRWMPASAGKFIDDGILPSNIPLKLPGLNAEMMVNRRIISTGIRNFNTGLIFPRGDYTPSFPLPVHIEINDSKMKLFLEHLEIKNIHEHQII